MKKILSLIMAIAMISTMAIAVSASSADDASDTADPAVTTADPAVTTAAPTTTAAGGTGTAAAANAGDKLNTGVGSVLVIGGVAVLAAGAIVISRKRK